MRRLLLSASLLSLAACATTPPGAGANRTVVAGSVVAGPVVWAHQASDLPVDPAVRFGKLPNGMRYAIMKNATPPGEASLRLRIDAGSLDERDDQRGIAHFLEHMVLNGTKNVPEGDFVKRLERAGLRFGPDTNASTDFEQTVFKLDLPRTDDATLTEAMFLLREVADEATLEAAAIDSERGIILSEERTRASPGYRAALDEYAFALKGQRLPTRFPIGDTAVIRAAPRERFVEFYNGFYRPERATLIAVGDFDVAAVEARIARDFGTWQGEGPALAAADQGSPAPRVGEARVFVEPGLPSRVNLSWVRPADLRPDTAATRREALIEALVFRVLNRRLERIAAEPNPPFAGAGGGVSEDAESAERTVLSAVAVPGRWRDALAALTAEQRRLVQYGVTQNELQREIVDLRSSYTIQATGANTRGTRTLAEALVTSVNGDRVVTTPANQLARFEDVVRGLTAAAVNRALPALFTGSGPLVYMTSPTPIEGSERAVLAAYDGARATPVTAHVDVAAKAWPYESFDTPGAVVERREIGPGIDATAVRFANGTRLTVKKTAFKRDEIIVSLRFGGGRLDFVNDGKPTPEWALGGGFTDGGLGKLDWEEVKQTLTPNVVGIGLGVQDDRFTLSGTTRAADFGLELKLLAAYFTDAGWRPTGWDRSRSLADTIHDSMASTPGGVFGREAGTLLGPHLSRGPVELVIVGDVDVEDAIRQTAATFGALPGAEPRALPTPTPIRFPAATSAPVRLVHKGRADQGLAFIAWPTTGFYTDVRQARALTVLADVLQLRLTAEIREKQGTTYSPSTGHSPSETFDDYGYLSASIQAPPDKLAGFLADAERIARDLRDVPVTADELDRARKPSLANIARARASSNAWWLGNLSNVQTDPRVAAELRTQVADYEAVTPADLQRVARRFLLDARDWKLVVVPETPAVAAH